MDRACSMYAAGENKCWLYKNASADRNVRSSSYSSRKFSDKACVKDPPQVCGSRGYDKQSPKSYKTFKERGIGSWQKCSDKCKTNRCTSFAFRSGECALYDNPAGYNFKSDKGSPWQVYDANCPKPYTPPTTTRSSTPAATTAASNPGTAIMLPKQDPSIDRNDLRNILPRPQLTLVYAEKAPGKYMMKIAASMMIRKAVG